MVEWDAVELLRCVAEGVGLVRVRGDRLEATSLPHAWARFDEGCAQGSPVRPGASKQRKLACPPPVGSVLLALAPY